MFYNIISQIYFYDLWGLDFYYLTVQYTITYVICCIWKLKNFCVRFILYNAAMMMMMLGGLLLRIYLQCNN